MRTGKRETWEEALRGEPFAGSAFTERHKQNVLKQVAEMKPMQGQSGVEPTYTKSMKKLNSPRPPKSRKKGWGVGITLAAAVAGILLWNGQIMEPVVERFNPASALLLPDDVNKDLLTESMKRTIAVTMSDYLGKQLEVTMVRDNEAFSNVANTIYVEAGQKTDNNYAEFSLDAVTGELQMGHIMAEMNVNKLEPRYLSQIPSLLKDIGSDGTLKPIKANRFVSIVNNEGNRQPGVTTIVELGSGDGDIEGSIAWQEDEVMHVSGSVHPEQAPKEAVERAKQVVKAYSGYSTLPLTGVMYNKNIQDHWNTWDLTFGERYLVTLYAGKYDSGDAVSVYDKTLHRAFNSDAREEANTDEGKQRLIDVPETTIIKNAERMIENVFHVSIKEYRFSKDMDFSGQGTFKFENDHKVQDEIDVSYDAEGRITSLARTDN